MMATQTSYLRDFEMISTRIAVTVDMIATGTDVKPLECLCLCEMFAQQIILNK